MAESDPFFSMEIDSRLEETRGLSKAAMEALGELPDAFQVDLALTEAVNNAIEHAYRMEDGHRVRVEIFREPDRLRFDVIDWGVAIDQAVLDAVPDEVPDPDPLDITSWEESGRGLMIIKTSMDGMEYSSQGGENRFRFYKKTA